MIRDLCFEKIQKCTNNCKFCSSCSSLDMTNFIDYDLFKRTIEYLVSQEGIEEISISGGEPFLHKDLLKIIKLCKSYDIKTNLYTSGIVLNRLKEIEIDYEVLTYNERFIIEEMKKAAVLFYR